MMPRGKLWDSGGPYYRQDGCGGLVRVRSSFMTQRGFLNSEDDSDGRASKKGQREGNYDSDRSEGSVEIQGV